MPSGGNVSLSCTLPSAINFSLISPSPALHSMIILRPQNLAVQPFSLSVSLYFYLGFALWFYHATETTSLQQS